jgi:hypothetical protein
MSGSTTEALQATIFETLKSLVPETYHEVNWQKTVKYPYAAFTISSEELGLNQEGVTLEIDVYGNTRSNRPLLTAVGAIKDGLKYRRDLTETHALTYAFRTELDIPTLVKHLRRKRLVFYIRVDYRTGRY